jgi:hypothetical protein
MRVPRVFSFPGQCLHAKKWIHAGGVCYTRLKITQELMPPKPNALLMM